MVHGRWAQEQTGDKMGRFESPLTFMSLGKDSLVLRGLAGNTEVSLTAPNTNQGS